MNQHAGKRINRVKDYSVANLKVSAIISRSLPSGKKAVRCGIFVISCMVGQVYLLWQLYSFSQFIM